MEFYSLRYWARYQARILETHKAMLESTPMQNIKQML